MKGTQFLEKYLSMYQKNPSGKAFAPLAEAYRKLGMLSEAFNVLKKGLKQHPEYVLGYIILAHCYYDDGKYELSYATLKPLAPLNQDNLLLQKLFGDASYQLNYFDEAIQSYKYVLFINPKDGEVQAKVAELENHQEVIEEYSVVTVEKKNNQFDEEEADDWSSISFINNSIQKAKQITSEQTWDKNDAEPAWEVTPSDLLKIDASAIPDVIADEMVGEEIIEESGEKYVDLPDHNPDESMELYSFDDDVKVFKEEDDSPMVTHTLVDIYCAQQHYDKASAILEKMVKQNPKDKKSVEKLNYVRSKLGKPAKAFVIEEEESNFDKIQQKYHSFLKLIRNKSHQALTWKKF